MKQVQSIRSPFFKQLTNTFGLGKNLAKLIHEKLGLNTRNSPVNITRKHSRDFETLIKGIALGKKLKIQNSEIQEFEQTIRTHRGMKKKFKAPSNKPQANTNAKSNKKN